GFEFDEGAIVGDIGDATLETRADRIFRLDPLPRVVEQLLHAERDAVGLVIDLDDLDLHLLADIEHLGRMIDPPPGDIGDVQQAIDAAEIDERAVVGDVLDHAVDDLALFEVLHQLLPLFGAGFFQHGAARYDDIAAPAIHFKNLERLRIVHQRRHVADRPDVDLRARQESNRTVEVDSEAAFDLIEDDALDLFIVLEGLLELAPAFLAARLVARQHGFAERIFDPFEIDLDGVADLDLGRAARTGEFPQCDAALGLQPDIDDRDLAFDGDDRALDDRTFLQMAVTERFIDQFGEIFARRRGGLSRNLSHKLLPPPKC